MDVAYGDAPTSRGHDRSAILGRLRSSDKAPGFIGGAAWRHMLGSGSPSADRLFG